MPRLLLVDTLYALTREGAERERSNRCRLFVTERDRKRWHLRRELLVPGTPAERVAAIRAEISAWTPSARRAGRLVL